MTADPRVTAAPVVGYEGLYSVTSEGQAISLPRVNRYGRRIRARVLKPAPSTDGYLAVGLYGSNGRRTHKVHVLVAAAFIGPRPAGHEVRHLDGDHLNNSAGNLAYGTHLVNESDKVRHGTRARGSGHPTAKLTEAQVREIRRRYATGGIRQRDLAAEFGVSCSLISVIARGERWTHVAGDESPPVWPHKLTEDQVGEIRARYAAGGISQYQLATAYEVSQTAIYAVINRKSWRAVA